MPLPVATFFRTTFQEIESMGGAIGYNFNLSQSDVVEIEVFFGFF